MGGCSPKGFHEAKACKGTVEAASAASAAETAVPNFILGIYVVIWYEMICDDMWGFDGIWWDLMASYIVLLHALRKTQKYVFFAIFLFFFLKHVEARCKKPSNPIKSIQFPCFLHVFVHVFLFSSMRIAHAWALWCRKNMQKQIGAIKLGPWNALHCR